MQYIWKVFFLVLILFITQPVLSYADWHGHDGGGHGHDFGHRHSFVGVNFSVWPDNYYYYGAPYYPDEVLVSPPVYEPVVVQEPQTVITQAQATTPVIEPDATGSDTPDSITINIPNDRGSYTAVSLKRSGNGYTGPQGEFYTEFPKVSQLKVMYGK